MNGYLQLTIAQLRIFARNRTVIVFTLVFPILLMTALGSFIGNEGGTSLQAVVSDQDQTAASANLIEALRSQEGIFLSQAADQEQAKEALEKGESSLVLVIPSGYEDQLTAARQTADSESVQPAKINVFYDSTNQQASQAGLSLLQQEMDRISKNMVGYTPLIQMEQQTVQSVQLRYIDFLVPGIVAMMIMNSNLNGVAGQISSWRERGVLRRMQSTTLRASTFISAQITSRLILNGFQALAILVIGFLFFGTQVNGSWLLVILFVILGTLTFMSIGFIIAGLAKTPESAGPIAGFLSFPLLFLGGVFFPIENMPEMMQPIVRLIPIAHLTTALREVMNVGAGLFDLWQEALLLTGWMVAAFLVSVRTFKWE